MTTAFYRTGTVAVTQNSKVVTGTGTNWTTGPTKPLAGDVFIFNNKMYEIDNVVSDTEIRLYRNFEDSTASSKSYAIMRNASLNISARIAAQVAQVVNQKQIMVDEFHDFLTNNTDSTVPLTDTLGNTISVTPIPMLDKDYIEKIGGIDSAVNQAIQDINDAFDNFEYPVLTAAQRQAIIDANEEKYAASGMVHYGLTGSTTGLINEGLIATPLATPYANKLYLGAPEYTDNRIGTSKNEYSTQHIAGVVSEFVTGRSGDNAYSSQAIQLPPASDGTVVYDSTGDARGTGKANINLLTEIDPKYGDSAEDLYGVGTVAAKNEASNRAFEGYVKNGDFRLGDAGETYVTNGGSGTYVRNEGSATVTAGDTYNIQVNVLPEAKIPEGEFEVQVVVLDATGSPRLFHNASENGYRQLEVGTNTFRFTKGIGSIWVQPQTVEGGHLTFTDLSVKPVTEEVVTDRVDMFGLEQFDMVMKDGEIFDMIQSQSDTFGNTGVPTVTSVRPDSFFAVYDGQENIVKGKCVRWPDLTAEQKRKVAAYMKERLWVNEEGDLTFTAIRQRSFAGAGNGDWLNSAKRSSLSSIDPGYCLVFNNVAQPYKAQAGADVIPDAAMYWTTSETTATWGDKDFSSKGVFKATRNSSGAGPLDSYKGRCFFYVLGTASRLNQGAYHPSFNPSGTGYVRMTSGGANTWYNASAIKLQSKADCFNPSKINQNTSNPTGPFTKVWGDIASGGSGRPDGRYYDAIYADGLGGVVDRRLPAYASDSPEEAAKVWEKVKNGTYRGLEKLVWTKPIDTGFWNSSGHINQDRKWRYTSSEFAIYTDTKQHNIEIGDWLTVYDVTVGACSSFQVNSISTQWARTDDITKVVEHFGTFPAGTGDLSTTVYLMHKKEINLPVSGQFTQTDVIGDPENILQTDALKNGWLGYWVPVINTGEALSFPASRKRIDSGNLPQIYTSDLGESWTSFSRPFDEEENGIPVAALGGGNVYISTYQAFAKQTKPSSKKYILNGEAGIGNVLASHNYRTANGALVSESTIGKILTSSGGVPRDKNYAKLGWIIKDDGSIQTDYPLNHARLDLTAPTNDSPAIKALPYQISNNGQCSLGVHANELTYEDNPTVINITSTNLNENLVAGSLYRVDRKAGSSVMDGGLYYCTTTLISLGWESSQWYIAENGEVKRFDNNVTYLVPATLGWGDDGTMKITASGSDTFVDLNGNTNLSVVHELALPYGWTKNRARAGEQIEGVDL